MTTHAELDRLLAEAYPETFSPAQNADPDDEIAAEIDATIAEYVHAAETQLHRPLHPHEHDQIADAITAKYEEAADHADRVLGRFEADLAQQLPLLERDLGRKLLADEHAGVRAQAWHALNVRGEALDAEQAWEDHWRHHNTATGAEPPDMNSRHDVDKHMAAVALERRRQAEAEDDFRDVLDPAPTVEWAEGDGANAHMENTRRMQARVYELQGRDLPRDLQQYATTQPPEDDE